MRLRDGELKDELYGNLQDITKRLVLDEGRDELWSLKVRSWQARSSLDEEKQRGKAGFRGGGRKNRGRNLG